jgi:mannose-6-phosphate isomerase-like protein (cupin superfamily)
MEWTVAPSADGQAGFGPHRHGALEETFLIRSGELEFLIGEDATTVLPGDFIRVPAGVRHGYRNVTNEPVDLLVTFVPGGFEELFVRYRTDQKPQIDPRGFVDDAIRDFDSAFE